MRNKNTTGYLLILTTIVFTCFFMLKCQSESKPPTGDNDKQPKDTINHGSTLSVTQKDTTVFTTVPTKYSIIQKDIPDCPTCYDILIDKKTSKENIRWIVKELYEKYGSKLSIEFWVNKNANKKYNDFYIKEDEAFKRADKAVTQEDYDRLMGYYGHDLKSKVIKIEQLRADNMIATYSLGYINYNQDETQEKYP